MRLWRGILYLYTDFYDIFIRQFCSNKSLSRRFFTWNLIWILTHSTFVSSKNVSKLWRSEIYTFNLWAFMRQSKPGSRCIFSNNVWVAHNESLCELFKNVNFIYNVPKWYLYNQNIWWCILHTPDTTLIVQVNDNTQNYIRQAKIIF
jgi:hypothetical protein